MNTKCIITWKTPSIALLEAWDTYIYIYWFLQVYTSIKPLIIIFCKSNCYVYTKFENIETCNGIQAQW